MYKYEGVRFISTRTQNKATIKHIAEHSCEVAWDNGIIDKHHSDTIRDLFLNGMWEKIPKVKYPNPPHVHAELIKAWADGAEIEVYLPCLERWVEAPQPPWHTSTKYQIKPTKTERELKIEDLRKQARILADELDKLEKNPEQF